MQTELQKNFNQFMKTDSLDTSVPRDRYAPISDRIPVINHALFTCHACNELLAMRRTVPDAPAPSRDGLGEIKAHGITVVISLLKVPLCAALRRGRVHAEHVLICPEIHALVWEA